MGRSTFLNVSMKEEDQKGNTSLNTGIEEVGNYFFYNLNSVVYMAIGI
jgi:hypothetical protein